MLTFRRELENILLWKEESRHSKEIHLSAHSLRNTKTCTDKKSVAFVDGSNMVNGKEEEMEAAGGERSRITREIRRRGRRGRGRGSRKRRRSRRRRKSDTERKKKEKESGGERGGDRRGCAVSWMFKNGCYAETRMARRD
ncbi:uncharacterized protein LOC116434361 [Nomia melanderi]|uniref:uncharacterized protein LOC116434361 n=1 Tax=Nomia melanderi TaxID=2448451 RepID=UPI003FCD42F7